MRLMLASDVERDNLFVEIYDGDEQWAEVSFNQLKNSFDIRIFAPTSGDNYDFDLLEVQKILDEAKNRLLD